MFHVLFVIIACNSSVILTVFHNIVFAMHILAIKQPYSQLTARQSLVRPSLIIFQHFMPSLIVCHFYRIRKNVLFSNKRTQKHTHTHTPKHTHT